MSRLTASRTLGATINAWLTPDDAPTTLQCWRVFIPAGEEYEAALRGALLLLAEEKNWEKFGIQEPVDVAAAYLDGFFLSSLMTECVE